MRRLYVITTPTKITDLDSNELDLDKYIEHGWEKKAKNLQLRRWRALRRANKGFSAAMRYTNAR